jgi:molecular chaperone GrpE
MTKKTETTEKAPADQAEATTETETTSSPDTCSDNECTSEETTETTSTPEQELTVTLQRLQAEFENFKKRNEKEKSIFVKFANKRLLTQLLPIIDNFERALETNKDEGIKLIHQELLELLEMNQVKPIESDNQLFDPHLHVAMLQEASDKPAGTIVQTLQKGYILGDAVLRPASVKIAKKEEKDETESVQRAGDTKV